MRRAIFTAITDNFIGLGATFVGSLFEHRGVIDQADFVVLYHPEFAPLSDENKKLIYSIQPNAMFVVPDMSFLETKYLFRYKGGRQVSQDTDARLPNKKSVYIKLSIFFQAFYDCILWVDSDMLILRNIVDVLDLPVDFAAVPTGEPNVRGRVAIVERMNFNTGFFLVSSRFMDARWQDQMTKLLHQENFTQIQDQTLLNFLLRRESKLMLPHNYNWKMPAKWAAGDAAVAQRHARVVHFVGPSKWELLDESREDPLSVKFHQVRRAYNIPMHISA